MAIRRHRRSRLHDHVHETRDTGLPQLRPSIGDCHTGSGPNVIGPGFDPLSVGNAYLGHRARVTVVVAAPSADQLEKHDAQGEDIRLRGQLAERRLLRRHIADRSRRLVCSLIGRGRAPQVEDLPLISLGATDVGRLDVQVKEM